MEKFECKIRSLRPGSSSWGKSSSPSSKRFESFSSRVGSGFYLCSGTKFLNGRLLDDYGGIIFMKLESIGMRNGSLTCYNRSSSNSGLSLVKSNRGMLICEGGCCCLFKDFKFCYFYCKFVNAKVFSAILIMVILLLVMGERGGN